MDESRLSFRGFLPRQIYQLFNKYTSERTHRRKYEDFKGSLEMAVQKKKKKNMKTQMKDLEVPCAVMLPLSTRRQQMALLDSSSWVLSEEPITGHVQKQEPAVTMVISAPGTGS